MERLASLGGSQGSCKAGRGWRAERNQRQDAVQASVAQQRMDLVFEDARWRGKRVRQAEAFGMAAKGEALVPKPSTASFHGWQRQSLVAGPGHSCSTTSVAPFRHLSVCCVSS